ncbi:hypothetical protein XELAEV_18030837mg [Xenopus laevis]|uniref:Uncharacterized protein n=1 Tax=Xenopus laevis TaxID=8355 RepID=A0A974CLK0_XENLA|nr:hypothetical protein XELAEV_18030837mg [Xenopus laevis]
MALLSNRFNASYMYKSYLLDVKSSHISHHLCVHEISNMLSLFQMNKVFQVLFSPLFCGPSLSTQVKASVYVIAIQDNSGYMYRELS